MREMEVQRLKAPSSSPPIPQVHSTRAPPSVPTRIPAVSRDKASTTRASQNPPSRTQHQHQRQRQHTPYLPTYLPTHAFLIEHPARPACANSHSEVCLAPSVDAAA
ncbi:hypothetical protein PMIN03_009256 [Paraphaeosphaeria minitans]